MFPGFRISEHLFLSSYAIVSTIGLMAAGLFAVFSYKKRTKDEFSMIFVLLFGALGVFLGMHILYGITNIEHWAGIFKATDFLDFINRFALVFGGSVFYGGLIGGLISGAISAKVQKLPFDEVTDCAAPAIALFHGFGRIGCFLGGCCYGVEWEHGITFTNAIVESANGVPRVPVQLFESAFEFLLFFLLWGLMRSEKMKGRIIYVYLLIYPVGRFIIEFWRGDEYRGFLFGLSTSQLISILVFAAAAVGIVLKSVKKKSGGAEV